MSSGSLAGFPVVDVRAVLYDGSYHDVDSSVMAFQIAARAAFREGMRKAGVQLLEPIMKVEVVTPDEHMGDVIGNLNSRRGLVQEFTDKPGGIKVGRRRGTRGAGGWGGLGMTPGVDAGRRRSAVKEGTANGAKPKHYKDTAPRAFWVNKGLHAH